MRHEKDLIRIASFLDGLNAAFGGLCENQRSMVSAYNSLAEIWQDKVYSVTGQALTETAASTEKAYKVFTAVCNVLRKQHEILCEYQEIDEARHYAELDFPKNFAWENGYMNNGKIKVEATDIEAFERALAEYLHTLETELSAIEREYNAVGEAWNDDQYVSFGEYITAFVRKTETQIQGLQQLGALLDKKRQLIEAADQERHRMASAGDSV